jgi:hypothetical protein
MNAMADANSGCFVLRRRVRAAAIAICAALALGGVGAAAADSAKGTASYQGKSGPIVVTVKHVYLVKGPDAMTGKIIRRLVLSSEDVSAKLRGCATMMCSDGDIGEGMTLDLDSGSRLNYWFVGNNQLVQYSGTADPATLKLTADTPQRVAGKWELDARAAGGPKVDVEFDATLIKELAKLR